MTPKVSIIVPVYNSGRYIEATVSSIREQDLQDWELLLVDDGSTDDTPATCERLASADDRIRYLRQEANCGPSVARNTGIRMASGEYLAFIDSDDRVECDYLSKMANAADDNLADVVWCNYYEGTASKETRRSHGLTCGAPLDNKDALSFFLRERVGLGCLWNKLYRASFIKRFNLRLNPNRVHGEDWEFNMEVFKHNPKIIPINDFLYHYIRQNTGSVIASCRPTDYDTFVHSLNLKRQLAEDYGLDYNACAVNSQHIYMVLSLLMALAKSRRKNKRSEYMRIVTDASFQAILSSNDYTCGLLTLRYKSYLYVIKAKMYGLAYMLMNTI